MAHGNRGLPHIFLPNTLCNVPCRTGIVLDPWQSPRTLLVLCPWVWSCTKPDLAFWCPGTAQPLLSLCEARRLRRMSRLPSWGSRAPFQPRERLGMEPWHVWAVCANLNRISSSENQLLYWAASVARLNKTLLSPCEVKEPVGAAAPPSLSRDKSIKVYRGLIPAFAYQVVKWPHAMMKRDLSLWPPS